MKKLAIVRIGNPVLRKKCSPVPPELIGDKAFRDFLDAMVRTMHGAEGVGLAANQVGRDYQALVLECRANRRYDEAPAVPLAILLNPRLKSQSKETELEWEGCLSIPGYRGLVPRASTVTVEALTPQGETVRETVRGFYARILQHEIDHLNGLFYIDRMSDFRTWMHLDEFNRRFKTAVRDRT